MLVADQRLSQSAPLFLAALLAGALPEPGHSAITRTGYFGRHSDGRWLSPIEEVGESSLHYWMGRHMIG